MNSVAPSLPAPIFLLQKNARIRPLHHIFLWLSSRGHHNVGLQQCGILTIQLTMTQLAYDRLPTPRHAHRNSNLSPLATFGFGALVMGQLAPDTKASAGPALPPADQLQLENTRGYDYMFMLLLTAKVLALNWLVYAT